MENEQNTQETDHIEAGVGVETEDKKTPSQLAEEADDKKLNEIFAVDEPKTDETKSEVEGNDDTESETNTEESDDSASLNNKEDKDALIRALRRDGVPQSIIDQVSEDAEQLKSWGGSAMKRQAAVDSYTEQMAEAKTKLEAAKKEKSETTNTDDGTGKASKPDGAEESEVGNNSLDALTEELGEQAAAIIVGLQEQVTSLKDSIDASNRSVVEAETSRAIDAAKPIVFAEWGKVTADQEISITARMEQLGQLKPGTFKSVEEMMRTAATEVLGDPPAKKPKRSPSVQSSLPRRQTQQAKELTAEQRNDIVLDVLMAGGTKAEAEAALAAAG